MANGWKRRLFGQKAHDPEHRSGTEVNEQPTSNKMEKTMARFPKREAEIATLAAEIINVLTEFALGAELIFRIVTFNKTGEGLASNTVTATL